MKKIVSWILVFCMAFSLLLPSIATADYEDDVYFDLQAAEELGYNVTYDSEQ